MERLFETTSKVLLTFTLVFWTADLSAHNDGMVADTVNLDDIKAVKPMQVPFGQYDMVDTCEMARYAIVAKDGRYGIYDLQSHENMTAIDMDYAAYSRQIEENGVRICYFLVEKGIQIIAVR